jgi:16S rRNA (guanine1516-N2)-methyltransferase
MNEMSIAVLREPSGETHANDLAKRLELPLVSAMAEDDCLYLCPGQNGIFLRYPKDNIQLRLDFTQGRLFHRLKQPDKKQMVIKAMGTPTVNGIHILDGTAGFGEDSMLLAAYGYRVTMNERSAIVGAILDDALSRAMAVEGFENFDIQFVPQDVFEYLDKMPTDEFPDIVYLDPLFPKRSKTAKVKKKMQLIRLILEASPCEQHYSDAGLLELAMKRAKNRVVIKRPRKAQPFADTNPSHQIVGKTSRFDVYL